MDFKYILINTTCKDKEEAVNIANILLVKKLVSCVQMNNIESYYKWKGKVEISEEILLKIKSKSILFDKIEKVIKQNNSYETPQIIAMPIIRGSKEYLEWIDDVTVQE